MINLSRHLRLSKDTCAELNLTGKFSQEDLEAIGEHVWRGYETDERSRKRWLTRTQAAMDLAMQVQKDKSFPWAGCSNVTFPLVTIAALQWHARAYPELISGPDIVKARIIGPDPDGKKRDREERISAHMSYQLLEEDSAWEEQSDRGFLSEAIVGCMFKKSYFSMAQGHNVSELVLAKDLVVDYFAKSVETAERKTHCIPMSRNEIYEKCARGVFRDVRKEDWYLPPPSEAVDLQQGVKVDVRKGQDRPLEGDDTTPFMVLEQHVSMDLDGDGYAEPYIITITRDHHVPLRIVTRFEWDHVEFNDRGKIVQIRGMEYFTKYGFIPSPDGGIYDIGFGILLGPINESVSSSLNQLFDAGTLSTTAGGFLGRGAKFRGGQYTFSPFGWNRVDSTGDDLSKSIFPLPVREPSTVLFQLLTFLVDYANRIAGTVDVMVGENPGQNTPKYNMQTMLQEGQRIYNAIFKRQWRSMKEEFKKLWMLNAVYLSPVPTPASSGIVISREDYYTNPNAVRPAADPNLVTSELRQQQAMMMKQAAMVTPGYNKDMVERNFLRAIKVEGIEMFFPGSDKTPPLPNPKVEVEKLKAEIKKMEVKARVMEKVMELQEAQALNKAKITQLEAQAVSLLAGVQGTEAGLEIQRFQAQIGALKDIDESMRKHVELVLSTLKDQGDGGEGGMGGMAGPPSNAGAAGKPAAAMPAA